MMAKGMKNSVKKPKMTIDKLARMTQDEFLLVRHDMGKGFSGIRGDLKHFATKDDLHRFATKDDLHALKEDLRSDTAEILQRIDKVVTIFDAAEKDHAAHTILHSRIVDEVHGHDQRLKKLEARP